MAFYGAFAMPQMMPAASISPFYETHRAAPLNYYYPGVISYGVPLAPLNYSVGSNVITMSQTQQPTKSSNTFLHVSAVPSKPMEAPQSAIVSADSQGSKENIHGKVTGSPRKRTDESEMRKLAQQWAYRQGFSSTQSKEFDTLMQVAFSKWIPKKKLQGIVQIDSGSFGKIYRTTYEGTEVAVKEIGHASSSNQSSLKTKMKEILFELDALVKVDHPNVVSFRGSALDFTAASGSQPSIGLVFEMCHNGSLHKMIFEKRRGLSVPQKVLIGAQVAAGLAYLHKNHILHRDLNSRNILLSSDLTAKIADFGCARMLSATTGKFRCPEILGSPAYMSPEQMQAADLTSASDVWALSMLLWEMMTEKKPWEGIYNQFEHLKHATVYQGARVPMPYSTGTYPAAYVNHIRNGMRALPQDRPTASKMQQDLELAIASHHPS